MFLLKHLLTHCLCGGHSRCAWGTSHCAAHLHPGPPAQATPAEQAAARGWRSQQENRGDDREHLRFWEPPHLPRDLWLFPVLCSCASTVPRTPLGLVRQQLCCRAWTRPSPSCYLEASNLTLALNSLLLLESMPAARKKLNLCEEENRKTVCTSVFWVACLLLGIRAGFPQDSSQQSRFLKGERETNEKLYCSQVNNFPSIK